MVACHVRKLNCSCNSFGVTEVIQVECLHVFFADRDQQFMRSIRPRASLFIERDVGHFDFAVERSTPFIVGADKFEFNFVEQPTVFAFKVVESIRDSDRNVLEGANRWASEELAVTGAGSKSC